MIRRRDRLYDYVRQATQLDGARTAALGDRTAQDILLEEITQMDAPSRPVPQASARRLRPVLITAGVALVAAVLTLSGLLGWWDKPSAPAGGPQAPVASAQPEGDVFGPTASLSCMEAYGPQTLAHRGFAFDGAVVSIGAPAGSGEQADMYVPVTFRVNHWFKGGSTDEITVSMLPPGGMSSVGSATYGVGSRLLVSGEDRNGDAKLTDPLAWACGFTRWYGATDTAAWTQTFR